VSAPPPAFGEYVVCLDESGDHGLAAVVPKFPAFVVSACIFRKDLYGSQVVPAFLGLKFRHFGHDMVVLHSRDIRRNSGPFDVLRDAGRKARFLADLDATIAAAPFTVVSAAIDKRRLAHRARQGLDLYDIALRLCMERVDGHLRGLGQADLLTHFVCEARGGREDDSLELSFRRTAGGENRNGRTLRFDIVFADKKANSTGMQIADLVSYPIGRHVLDPGQPNQAYDVVATKFRMDGQGKAEGWGLKLYP